MLLHYINDEWVLCSRLAVCAPFSKVSHSAKNIAEYTWKGLHDVGIGESPSDVPRNIHVGTPDEGSNMLAAWKDIEGAGCCCHREQSCLKEALSVPEVLPLVGKVKGTCAHFHRTHKVSPV